MISPTLKLELSQLEADFCSALSDPTRLLILYALGEGARNVNDLAGELAIPQPTASRHLKVLRDRGLVLTTRQGTSVTYQLADARILEAIDLLRKIMGERLAYRAGLVEETIAE
ncbi:MAG: ArsR family transcriptional regulator [Anaerolineae bacterium CFX3]|nr:winged helix-turn-helix transcriptional regulator [Anaerolineae bacterium]MCE7905288.1 ArsR family transcriptional regulator [Anaerolineae bacterium CFX3]MCQ3945380.1 transcriptional regulator [Anaerolineae bacterium]RIK24674.1 MAG: transcriptional regulator [Anaerolineae bacterium]